ncbi:MAG: large repetitive protein [Thermomicrobiales bacterium]|nr:large repetitive protein [Thermomicrobiales bacterium]
MGLRFRSGQRELRNTSGPATRLPGSWPVPRWASPSWARPFVLLTMSVALATAPLSQGATIAESAEMTCGRSGPKDRSYAVTVCITQPMDDAQITGDQVVEASVSVSGSEAAVRSVTFTLDGEYVLSAYVPPYRMLLSSGDWPDGVYRLEAQARMAGDFATDRVGIRVRFTNGLGERAAKPPAFKPSSGTSPAPGEPFVVAAVGDGAGGKPAAAAVTNLIDSWNPNLFLYLGDVYNSGSPAEFANWYAPDTYFGRFRDVSNPTIGNHEYGYRQTLDGYMGYWGAPPHYYSFEANGWHFVSLDSNDRFGELEPGTEQYEWLVEDLATNSAVCTILFFHHPVFNIGEHGDKDALLDIWRLAVERGVDLVLTGHDHNYQRWQPMDASANRSALGVTEFVVGTGGQSNYRFQTSDSRVAHSIDDVHGALRLELNREGAAYRFISTDGATRDAGTVPCRGALPDQAAPNVPDQLVASASQGGEITLAWRGALDNVGTVAYDVYRDGSLLATVAGISHYADAAVQPGQSYTYRVSARDAAGNASPLSEPVGAVAVMPALFSDGFERGDFSRWNVVKGLAVDQQDVASGSFAARANSAGEVAFARDTLDPPESSLSYRVRFKILDQGKNPVTLLRFRAHGESVLGVFVTQDNRLSYFDDVTRTSNTSRTKVTLREWHEVDARILVDGPRSRVEIWLDGEVVADLNTIEDLGTAPVDEIQMGDSAPKRRYDVLFDEVLVDVDAPLPATQLPANSSPAAETGTATPAVNEPSPSPDAEKPATPVPTVQEGTSDVIFSDDFDGGDLTLWDRTRGFRVERGGRDGGYLARATSNRAPAYAVENFTMPEPAITYVMRFRLMDQETGLTLVQFRSEDGKRLLGVEISSDGQLRIRNEVGGHQATSSITVSRRRWHQLEVGLRVGEQGRVEIRYDGKEVPELNGSFGSDAIGIGALQLGDNASSHIFDITFDDVLVRRDPGRAALGAVENDAPVASRSPARGTLLGNEALPRNPPGRVPRTAIERRITLRCQCTLARRRSLWRHRKRDARPSPPK